MASFGGPMQGMAVLVAGKQGFRLFYGIGVSV